MNTIYHETQMILTRSVALRMIANVLETNPRMNRVILCGHNIIVYAEYKGQRKDRDAMIANIQIVNTTKRNN